MNVIILFLIIIINHIYSPIREDMNLTLKLVFLVLLVTIPTYCQLPEDDEVTTAIPGYNHPIYSGYLDISISTKAKSIHYVYFQSQRDVAKDPLVVWLNGGPGCSGLISMLQQNGPFIIAPGEYKPVMNQNAWNKRANLVYFQAPAGVGYSQSLSNDTITDQIVSQQLIGALTIFLDRHSTLKKNNLYIAASGYGAVFATYLARSIINRNKDPALIFWTKINLKGLLLGNPCVNPDECFASGSQRNSVYHYQFLYSRGFMTKKSYYDYLGKCAIVIDPYSCFVARQKLDIQYKNTNTSEYNLYAKCYSNNTKTNSINLGCQDQSGATDYLNDPHFRQNWNIRPGQTWAPCNLTIWNQYQSGNGSLHLIDGLIKDNLRMWVYSGDMDSTVPIIGTKTWINYWKILNQIPTRKNWRQWWIPGKHKFEDQVGGFIWELEGLTMVTVKAAGFKASADQPIGMQEVLNGFLDGKTLPYKAQ